MVSHKLHIKPNLLHARNRNYCQSRETFNKLAQQFGPQVGKRVAIVAYFTAQPNCDLYAGLSDLSRSRSRSWRCQPLSQHIAK